MSGLVIRRWRADGGDYAEWRRKGSHLLVARREGDRLLVATDASKAEREEVENAL